jgi:hypothetical protein
MSLLILFSTQRKHIKPIRHNCIALFPLFPLAGFEPRSSVPKVDAMATMTIFQYCNYTYLFVYM